MKNGLKILAIVLIAPPVFAVYLLTMAAFVAWCSKFLGLTP
jgi:hypothetical protein